MAVNIIIAVLCISSAVCFIGWIKNKIGLLTLSAYIVKKQYTPPTEDEIKACTAYVVKNLLKDISRSPR